MKYICARLANATTSNCNIQAPIWRSESAKADSMWTHQIGCSYLLWLVHHQRRMACQPASQTEPSGHFDQTPWFPQAYAHPFLVPSPSWLPANVTYVCQKPILCSYWKNQFNLTLWWWGCAFTFLCIFHIKCKYFTNKKNNITKYTAFCGETNANCAACLKKML